MPRYQIWLRPYDNVATSGAAKRPEIDRFVSRDTVMRTRADVTSQVPRSAMRRVISLERNPMGGVHDNCIDSALFSFSFSFSCRSHALIKYVSYECTIWNRIWRTLLYMRRADSAYALTKWQHFSACNDVDVMHGRHLESVTSNRKYDSVNRCAFTWRICLPNFIFHPDPLWNDETFGFFKKRSSQ